MSSRACASGCGTSARRRASDAREKLEAPGPCSSGPRGSPDVAGVAGASDTALGNDARIVGARVRCVQLRNVVGGNGRGCGRGGRAGAGARAGGAGGAGARAGRRLRAGGAVRERASCTASPSGGRGKVTVGKGFRIGGRQLLRGVAAARAARARRSARRGDGRRGAAAARAARRSARALRRRGGGGSTLRLSHARLRTTFAWIRSARPAAATTTGRRFS